MSFNPGSISVSYKTDNNTSLRSKYLSGTYSSSNKTFTSDIDLGSESIDGNNWLDVKNISFSGYAYNAACLYEIAFWNNYGTYKSNHLNCTVSFNKFSKSSTPAPTPTPTPSPTPTPTNTKYQITVSSVNSSPSDSSTMDYKENGTGTLKTAYGSYDSANKKVTYTVNTAASSLSVTKLSIGGKIYDTAKTVKQSSPSLSLSYSYFYKTVYLYVSNVPSSSISAEVRYTEGTGSSEKTLSLGSYNSSSKKYTFNAIKTTADYITVKKLTLSQKQPSAKTVKITGTSYTFNYNDLANLSYNYQVTVSGVPSKPGYAKMTYKLGSSSTSKTDNVKWSYSSDKVTFTLPSESGSIYVTKIEIDNRYTWPYKTIYSSSPSYSGLSYSSMSADSISYKVTVTGVNSKPSSSALTHSGSSSSVSGTYYSSSKKVEFSFTSKNAVNVTNITLKSSGYNKKYAKSLALSYSQKEKSVALSDFSDIADPAPTPSPTPAVKDGTYQINITGCPCFTGSKPDYFISYTPNKDKIQGAADASAYNSYNKTFTLTINSKENSIVINELKVESRKLNQTKRIYKSDPVYTVKYSDLKEFTSTYKVKVTNVTSKPAGTELVYKELENNITAVP